MNLNEEVPSDFKIKRSALITAYSTQTGIGTLARYAFKLGFLERYVLFNSVNSNNEDNTEIVGANNKVLNKIEKYFSSKGIQTKWQKYIQELDFIHLADIDFMHLIGKNKPSVVTIHDLFPLQMSTKDDYSKCLRSYFGRELSYLEKATNIVVVSKETQSKLQELYPNIATTIIRPWTDNSFKTRSKNNARLKLGLPLGKTIILNVSSEDKRKNIEILPKIMNQLGQEYLLVRIGPSRRISSKFLNKNLVWFENISPENYPYFFNAADVVIAPSFEEGFGIPIIQSINSNVPLIVSNINIYHEILGHYKFFSTPFDAADWVDKIKEINCKIVNDDSSLKLLYSHVNLEYKEERAKKQYYELYKKTLSM